MRNREKHSIEQSFLYRLGNRRTLAENLNLPTNFFRRNYKQELNYNNFSIPKKDGSDRVINDPYKSLKDIQRKVLKHFNRIVKPEWLMSGRKGRSYLDNGKYHRGSRYAITIDIKDFYPSCSRNKVYLMFCTQFEMEPDIAGILTDLTVLENTVPTGAPTSQAIMYWVYSEAFKKLNRLAESFNCRFSLYVDDMAFSSEQPISFAILDNINDILRETGLRIKWPKLKKYGPNDCKLITGVVLDAQNNLKVPNKLRRSIIDLANNLKNPEISEVKRQKLLSSLSGKVRSAQSIEPGIFSQLLSDVYTVNARKNVNCTGSLVGKYN